jgi:hypothetical protein
MKINELIAEQQNIEEGIGSFLGKAAGHVAGGLGASWRDAKQGYKDAKAVWDPKDPPGTYNNDPATAGAETTPPAGPNPDELRKQAAALTQQADQIEKAASQPTTPPPAPTTTTQPAPTTATEPATQEPAAADPAQWPAGLPKFNSVTGQKFASPEEAEQVINSPEFKQQAADIAAGKEPTQQQTTPAPTTPPVPTNTTTPAPTTPPANTPPPADGKMTAAQQAALKAKLQGQRQAGKSIATQTSGSFKDYVGGSGETMTGVDASGAPIYKKIQRESVEFRSNFLGMMI